MKCHDLKNTYMRIFLLFLVSIMLTACQHSGEKADTIYYNAVIWTGDSSQPHATAIGIKDGKILFTGDDYTAYKSASTQLIDLQGKMIVPGMIDNHTHFLSGGYNLGSIDLRQAKSKQDFIRIVKEFCVQHPDDRWIQGGDWDHEAMGGMLPEKEWIDSVSGDHPIFVSRYDGHMAFANSKALQLAKLDNNMAAPEGGEIVRNAKKEMTGVFKDEAMSLIYRVIPDPSQKELDEYLIAAEKHAFAHGVTQVHDMGSYGGWIDLATYKRAYTKKELQLRVYSFVALWSWAKLDSLCKKDGKGDDLLRWGGVKGFADGSLGSTTAWFYQPYLDAPNTSGLTVTDTVLLRKWILAADSAGLHVAIHAIGDRANDLVLDCFAEAEQRTKRDHRFRIEHAQHLSAAALSRFNTLQVIPSMQPYHAIDDGRWAAKRLDDDRLKRTYAFGTLLHGGARLTFGSDWTVAPLDPIAGIYAAVTRRTLDDKNPDGWYPAEKLTVEEALHCYTSNNAFAGFQENKTGVLRKGMLADMVVLSDNLLTIPAIRIKDVKVLRTIVNGKEVYIAPAQ